MIVTFPFTSNGSRRFSTIECAVLQATHILSRMLGHQSLIRG